MRLLSANTAELGDEGEDRVTGTIEETASFVSTYKKICRIKKKYRVYRKVLFHLHTPVSYDCKLLDEWRTDDNKIIEFLRNMVGQAEKLSLESNS